jgi:hypothetical protein
MLNRVSYGEDILAHAQSPTIKSIYIKWKTLSQLKRLALNDFLEPGNRTAERLSVLLSLDNDYFYIYQGAIYREELGFDLSGRLHSQMTNRLARDMRSMYDQVRETKIPVHLIYASDTAKYALAWERLILPLVINDEVRIIIRYNEPINSAIDVHNYLFGNSPHNIIVALPIANYDGETIDADIIDINPAAMKFFSTDRFSERPIQLRQLTPFFDDDQTWKMLTAKSEIVNREHFVVDRRDGTAYKFIVVRLDYLLLMRIYPTATLEMVTTE